MSWLKKIKKLKTDIKEPHKFWSYQNIIKWFSTKLLECTKELNKSEIQKIKQEIWWYKFVSMCYYDWYESYDISWRSTSTMDAKMITCKIVNL